MTNQLKPFHKKLLREIEEILFLDWNPIGDVPKDEYSSYALQILRFIIDFCSVENIEDLELLKATKKDIANFLSKTETKEMGLDGDIMSCQKVAEKVLQVAEKYMLYFKLDNLLSILKKRENEQKGKIQTSRAIETILATIDFIEDLLKIEWEKYTIDNKKSFVEEIGDPI